MAQALRQGAGARHAHHLWRLGLRRYYRRRDYTVHIVVGVDPEQKIYVLDLWRKQASSDEWIEAFCDLVVDGSRLVGPRSRARSSPASGRSSISVRVSVGACVATPLAHSFTANQERELRQVAERAGWQIVRVYKDHGISGSKGKDKRPEFDALHKAAARREFDVVMAWSVDRLGRSLQDLVGFLSEIHAAGVDLFLHQQGIDTTSPGGKAMFRCLVSSPSLSARSFKSGCAPALDGPRRRASSLVVRGSQPSSSSKSLPP